MELRYVGFDQHDNTRAYKFDSVSEGQHAVRLVITADLTLFLKHHVSIQEGPILCARKLTTDPATIGPENHRLTDEDLLAFTTARTAEEALKAKLRLARRRPPRPLYIKLPR
jgi:hypothetical protein